MEYSGAELFVIFFFPSNCIILSWFNQNPIIVTRSTKFWLLEIFHLGNHRYSYDSRYSLVCANKMSFSTHIKAERFFPNNTWKHHWCWFCKSRSFRWKINSDFGIRNYEQLELARSKLDAIFGTQVFNMRSFFLLWFRIFGNFLLLFFFFVAGQDRFR